MFKTFTQAMLVSACAAVTYPIVTDDLTAAYGDAATAAMNVNWNTEFYYKQLQSLPEPTTAAQFAQNIQYAVMSWYMNQGYYIFTSAASDAVQFAENKIVPLAMPLVSATSSFYANLPEDHKNALEMMCYSLSNI